MVSSCKDRRSGSGVSTVFDALESDSLAFVRQHGCLAYVGNGNGISLFVVKEAPDRNKKIRWWQKAMFGDVEEALTLQWRTEHHLLTRTTDSGFAVSSFQNAMNSV